MPETSYRLPEWLGGHAVRVVQHDLAGFSQPHVLVAIQGGDYDGLPLALPSEQLVEVKPPSIDDPAGLPQEFHFDDPEDGSLSLWLKERTETGWTVAEIYDHRAAKRSRAVLLNAGQLRRLAQAAWQRAEALEATP